MTKKILLLCFLRRTRKTCAASSVPPKKLAIFSPGWRNASAPFALWETRKTCAASSVPPKKLAIFSPRWRNASAPFALWSALLLCTSCTTVPTTSAGPASTTAQTTATSGLPPALRATGSFDYYLLTMSWSPEFCHSRPDSPECGSHFGFIVHGLWPQNAHGYPENCAQQRGPTNPQQMLDLMPDLHLIQHEWATHGTCTGLSADNYFALIRRIRGSVKIPQDLVAPQRQLTVTPAELKQDFEQANSDLKDSEIALSCGSGPYLVAVEICFSKDGKPIPCAGDIRDCNRPEIRIPRVQ
jgi:ribonuclease T2